MFKWIENILNKRVEKIIEHKDMVISELVHRFPWNSTILSSILPPKNTIILDDIIINIRDEYQDLIYSTTIEYDDVANGKIDEIIAASTLDVRSDIYDKIIYIDILAYATNGVLISYKFHRMVKRL